MLTNDLLTEIANMAVSDGIPWVNGKHHRSIELYPVEDRVEHDITVVVNDSYCTTFLGENQRASFMVKYTNAAEIYKSIRNLRFWPEELEK